MPRKIAIPTVNFEKSLNQLVTLVEKIEHGQLSLEESLAHFETGIGLIRECQQALTQAEQKIQVLVKENNVEILKPYPHEPHSNE